MKKRTNSGVSSADILIIWDQSMTPEIRDFLQQPKYEQVHFDMGKLAQCEDTLLVFRRIP